MLVSSLAPLPPRESCQPGDRGLGGRSRWSAAGRAEGALLLAGYCSWPRAKAEPGEQYLSSKPCRAFSLRFPPLVWGEQNFILFSHHGVASATQVRRSWLHPPAYQAAADSPCLPELKVRFQQALPSEVLPVQLFLPAHSLAQTLVESQQPGESSADAQELLATAPG